MTQPLVTLEDMERMLGVSKGRIETAMKKLNIKVADRVGTVRMFRRADVALIRAKLVEISPPPKKIRARS